MNKDYCGGIINIGGGRKINIGEEIIVNSTNKKGIVVKSLEGNCVFLYYIRFPGESKDFFGHSFNTNEITPVLNP